MIVLNVTPSRDNKTFTVAPPPLKLQRIVFTLAIVQTSAAAGERIVGAGAVLSSTETLLLFRFVVATSNRPSRLKSPAASADGPSPVANGEPKTAPLNEPEPLPNSIETVSSSRFATARSSAPSRLKSAATIDDGEFPAAKFTAASNVPSPFPSRIETLSLPPFATARSGIPSPLKSPTATPMEPVSA